MHAGTMLPSLPDVEALRYWTCGSSEVTVPKRVVLRRWGLKPAARCRKGSLSGPSLHLLASLRRGQGMVLGEPGRGARQGVGFEELLGEQVWPNIFFDPPPSEASDAGTASSVVSPGAMMLAF